MPGTGKTATTLEVVKALLAESETNRKKLPRFEFIQINAMSLTNPNLVYTILNEKITGNRSNPTASAAFLDEFFKKGDKLKVLKSRVKNVKTKER
jgi:Cdc6-like AAA superfamily ATPase